MNKLAFLEGYMEKAAATEKIIVDRILNAAKKIKSASKGMNTADSALFTKEMTNKYLNRLIRASGIKYNVQDLIALAEAGNFSKLREIAESTNSPTVKNLVKDLQKTENSKVLKAYGELTGSLDAADNAVNASSLTDDIVKNILGKNLKFQGKSKKIDDAHRSKAFEMLGDEVANAGGRAIDTALPAAEEYSKILNQINEAKKQGNAELVRKLQGELSDVYRSGRINVRKQLNTMDDYLQNVFGSDIYQKASDRARKTKKALAPKSKTPGKFDSVLGWIKENPIKSGAIGTAAVGVPVAAGVAASSGRRQPQYPPQQAVG